MDPYLEPHWLDVHASLAVGSRDSLNQQLPEDLVASVEERVVVESPGGEDHLLGPDVRVFEPLAESEATNAAPSEAGVSGVVEAPYRLLAQVEPMVERFVRVIEPRTERLVTVIEFVSPTNKQGEGLHTFRQKRGQLLASGVNFVEVDLHRSGNWRALLRPHLCPAKAVTPYRATIRVPTDPGATYLHPIGLRARLPVIAIPLRRTDPRVTLDLQDLIDRAYANGRYARRLDYSKPCDPPLDEEDALWVRELLREAGRG